jgi:hypothetical protein
MDGKLRHRPKTFMRSARFKKVVLSSNCSNNGEVWIYPAAQILFSVLPISQVIEVQMHWLFFFFGKLRQFPRTFMRTIYSNSDISNDVLFRQEDKDYFIHQNTFLVSLSLWILNQNSFYKGHLFHYISLFIYYF